MAFAICAGAWTRRSAIERVKQAVSLRERWLSRAVGRVVASMDRPGDPAVVEERLLADPKFVEAGLSASRVLRWYQPEPRAVPRWPVPLLHTPGDVAQWLGLSPGELGWFADTRRILVHARSPALQHYRHQWVPKQSGGWRLLEAPLARLKALQRRVLHEILDRVPPHAAATAFVKGGSALVHASRHAGTPLVLRLDLEDFFPSTRASRVLRVFTGMGYPRTVARLLAGLCTHVMPDTVLAPPLRPEELGPYRRQRARLRDAHLPQGAPTSPALANLCAWRLDLRLSALGESIGLHYSRYADDLAFSGAFDRPAAGRLAERVAAIAREEGYTVNHRKTKASTQAERQVVTGIVVNAHPNLPRRDYDRLKAVLHDAATRGPAAANRAGHADFRAHLRGKVAWAEALNSPRGAKLRALFERIAWGDAAHAGG